MKRKFESKVEEESKPNYDEFRLLKGNIGRDYALRSRSIPLDNLQGLLKLRLGKEFSSIKDEKFADHLISACDCFKLQGLIERAKITFQAKPVTNCDILMVVNETGYKDYQEELAASLWIEFWRQTQSNMKLRLEFCWIVSQSFNASLCLMNLVTWSVIFHDLSHLASLLADDFPLEDYADEKARNIAVDREIRMLLSRLWDDYSIYAFLEGFYYGMKDKDLLTKEDKFKSLSDLILMVGDQYFSENFTKKLKDYLATESFQIRYLDAITTFQEVDLQVRDSSLYKRNKKF